MCHWITGIVVVLASCTAYAQLKLSTSLDHSAYLQCETINALLTIENIGDDPFAVTPESKGDPDVFFLIEQRRDEPMKRLRTGSLIERISVAPDARDTVMVTLSDWYDVRKMGRYRIAAGVRWRGQTYLANPVVVDVVRGLEMVNVSRPVRGYPQRERRYGVRYWSRDGGEQAFLVVDEKEGEVNYGTFPLGPIVRYQKPQIRADRDGTVTVVHQSAPDRYTRSTFDSRPDEVLFVDQRYFTEDGTPYESAGSRVFTNALSDAVSEPATNLPDRPRKKGGLLQWLFGR